MTLPHYIAKFIRAAKQNDGGTFHSITRDSQPASKDGVLTSHVTETTDNSSTSGECAAAGPICKDAQATVPHSVFTDSRNNLKLPEYIGAPREKNLLQFQTPQSEEVDSCDKRSERTRLKQTLVHKQVVVTGIDAPGSLKPNTLSTLDVSQKTSTVETPQVSVLDGNNCSHTAKKFSSNDIGQNGQMREENTDDKLQYRR